MIMGVDWDSLISHDDINLSWSNWHSTFMNIMESTIPQAILKPRKNLPWITKPILQAMRRRNSLYRSYRKSNDDSILVKYKSARNSVVSLLRQSKAIYFQNLSNSGGKKFWKAVKLLNKQDSSIPTLIDSTGASINSSSEKASLLNYYFNDCFNVNVPPLQVPPLRNHTSCPNELLCSDEVVEELLLSLLPDKSIGFDGVSPKMLKFTAFSIAPSLTNLFNLSITTGTLPAAWKHARIVPIFKKGDKSLPSNYRPISVLSTVSKVLERHIHSLIFSFITENSLISDCQWGFMPHRSTTSALCSITHNWLSAMNDGNEICSVFFDLRKAFDSVPHGPLLDRLLSYSLDPSLVAWIHGYLAGRTQTVVVGGEQSASLPVISGVPQGSVLGPLLFIIYVNDLTSVISPYSKLSMFADDIALYRSITAAADYPQLQSDITAINFWVQDNHLSFNVGKCCTMLVTRRSNSYSNFPPPLFLGNTVLTQVDSVKYLGITLTTDLSWSLHISNINAKTRKLLGLLYRRFYFCSAPALLTLYTSFIRPHLEYASPVWDPYLRKDINLLHSTQAFALRVVTKDWSCSSENLHRSLNLPTLSVRRHVAKLSHLYKIVHKIEDFRSPPLTFKTLRYKTRNSHSLTLSSISSHSAQFFFSFFPHTISLWNTLNFETVNLSLDSFKKFIILSR